MVIKRRCARSRRGDAEVGDPKLKWGASEGGLAVFDEDVPRVQVSVGQAFGLKIIQKVEHLEEEVFYEGQRDIARLDVIGEHESLYVFGQQVDAGPFGCLPI